MTLQFVDTNVLLYAYDPAADDRHELARELVGRLGRERLGAVSVQVLQELYVNLIRKVAVPLSADVALQRIRILSRWRTHSPIPDDVIAAAELAEAHLISFWDAMIIRSASELRCEILWTEDLNHGQRVAGVEIANPFADL